MFSCKREPNRPGAPRMIPIRRSAKPTAKLSAASPILPCARRQTPHGSAGVWHEGIDKNTDWALAIDEARWRKAEAAGAGVEYAVEPHVGSLTPIPPRLCASRRTRE